MTGVTTTRGDKQREGLMLFMRAFRDTNRYLPTIADMASGMGMNRTAIVWHLEILRREGQIDYVDGHMSHSLRLTR
jgi:SOS-response transcriptional repressor LexA